MSALLDGKTPYAPRAETDFLKEMNELTAFHRAHCETYRRIWPCEQPASNLADLPWLHVGLFKRLDLVTRNDELQHERTLSSSATSSGVASRIALDKSSSARQAASSAAILSDFLGSDQRPLLVLDSARSLIARSAVSARIAAAMCLRPIASDMHFLLGDANDPSSLDWDLFEAQLRSHEELLIYGFTWMLWLALGAADIPEKIHDRMRHVRMRFVHSGGWKKLEAERIDRSDFDRKLLDRSANHSTVTDFYGLVEQVGIIYPLCDAGYRHAPRWADILVRDPWTMAPLEDDVGLLQLMNTLPQGAPYHNVLTEDLGRIVPGSCGCGRAGTRFVLEGRVPKSELRGCANV